MENIPAEMFEFAQESVAIHDKKLSTKQRGYFADAFQRFKKNKSSLVAACIIGFLVLYALIVPIVSPYTVKDKNNVYVNYPPFIPSFAESKSGIFNGGITYDDQSEFQLQAWHAIGQETGRDPVISINGFKEVESIKRGQKVKTKYYSIDIDRYYGVGIRTQVISYEEFQRIQDWQNENNIQVLYPVVSPKDIEGINNNPNIWYKVSDSRGTPIKDSDGNLIPAYSTDASIAGPVEYNSIRIAGDDGSYIYSLGKSGSLQCRVDYYNYYIYLNGREPYFIFGTNTMGQDLFTAIAIGARFSLIFAIVVSAINLTIGAIYGAIQGYYGGILDLIMDRIADILSGVPFIVVATLFQLHLAQRVGTVVSFLFAFVLTGWLGMAALTRTQFYRFKGQEFVYAAKTLGASDRRLMFKHIFPNSLGTIITSCALVIPGVIGSETNLTYLGIVNLSEFAGTTVGVLMAQGQTVMTTSPHAMFYPAIFVSLLLISFNLFGNGLRDAFNPSTRGADD